MRSVSFRLLSAIVWLLLLVALALVIVLVVRSNPPGTQSLSLPPTRQTSATAEPIQTAEKTSGIRPTFTSTPGYVQPQQVSLLGTKRILAGGFSFRPLEGYSIEVADGSVTMSAPEADPAIGPTLLLIGGPNSALIESGTESVDDAFDQFVGSFAQDGGFQVGQKTTVSTRDLTGIAAELSNLDGDSQPASRPFAGRVFMARPNPPQFFFMIAISPTELWQSTMEQEFEAVLDSVALFNLTAQFSLTKQPTAAILSARQTAMPASNAQVENSQSDPPIDLAAEGAAQSSSLTESPNTLQQPASTSRNAETISPILATGVNNNSSANTGRQEQWRVYTNSNLISEALIVDNTIWAATDGGVIAWDQPNNVTRKFTTADGLLANQATSIELCPLSDLGLVVGTAVGLQVFNLDNERWFSLTSQNSRMSYDDVSDVYCDAEYGFMVIGYQRHGIDIFDAMTGEWLHFDRNRALVSNAVHQLTVVDDRQEVWIVSDLGVTVLENIPEIDNRRSSFFSASNSPLQDQPISAITKAADGSIWLAQEKSVYHIEVTQKSVAGSTQREWTEFDESNVSGELFVNQPIAALAPGLEQTIWIGAEDGSLCQFDPETTGCVEFFAPNTDTNTSGSSILSGEVAQLTHVFTDDKGSVYNGTKGSGIVLFDGVNWTQLVLDDELLTSNQIRNLAQDNNGDIWIATASDIQIAQTIPESGSSLDRLAISQSATQQAYQSNRNLFDRQSAGEPITALWTDEIGRVWIGAESAARFDKGEWVTYTSINGLVGTPVQAFALDNQNRVWIGTGAGLNILNNETFFSLTKSQGLPDDNIQAVVADPISSENIVWIGTAAGGLLRFEKNQLEVFNKNSANLPSDSVTALGFDSDGSLLIGTDNGLARLVGGRAIKLRAIGDARITAITARVDSASIGSAVNGTKTETFIWIGTEENGVYHYDGLAWSQLPANKLPGPHIADILIDKDGNVWFGGATGGLVQHRP